jgi:hypothetical protein
MDSDKRSAQVERLEVVERAGAPNSDPAQRLQLFFMDNGSLWRIWLRAS